MEQLQTKINESPISEAEEFKSLLKSLSTDQIRFVIARQQCSTDAEAARIIGMNKSTVCQWGEQVQKAVKLMAMDGVYTALEIRRRALPEAMAVKAAGLQSDNERIRQQVSTEIIEWELGKATQKTEHSGEVNFKWDWNSQPEK